MINATTLATGDEFPMNPWPTTVNFNVAHATVLPRSRAARTVEELVPIAGYYGVLCMHNRDPVLDGHGASDRGYADFREFDLSDVRE